MHAAAQSANHKADQGLSASTTTRMSNILQERKTEITVGCILTIAVSVVYCTYILVVAPNVSSSSTVPQPPPPTFDQNGHLIQPSTTTVNPTQNTAAISTAPIIGIVIFLTLITAGAAGGYFSVRHLNKAKLRRDQQRLADLPAIAQAFQTYKDKVGTYPISTTYRSDYYTGINLSNDWHYYGLPNDDQMSKYLPNWPVSDPGIDYHAKSQVNQYLYYPHDNGARFDLYAHLELHQSAPNYNEQDNLPQAWGSYNYKISSDGPVPIVTPIVAPASQPAATPEPAPVAPPPSPAQAQPVAAPSQPVAPQIPTSPSNDNDIEPQAATAAASATLDQHVAEQQAMGAIDQLFAQGQTAAPSAPPPPANPEPSPVPLPESASPAQPARAPMDPHQTNSNQLDQMAQAMAARAQIADGSTTPEITQPQPPQKT